MSRSWTAVRRKRNKKGKASIVYKELVISPVKRMLSEADPDPSSTLKKRLHICRGHFKDYRNGRGLFGRYQGLFWWDMHVRGDKAAGKVEKDYAISPS